MKLIGQLPQLRVTLNDQKRINNIFSSLGIQQPDAMRLLYLVGLKFVEIKLRELGESANIKEIKRSFHIR